MERNARLTLATEDRSPSTRDGREESSGAVFPSGWTAPRAAS